MRRAFVFLASLVLLFSFTHRVDAQANNFCMDCLQKQIEHDDPNHHWYESDAFCCPAPCAGYETYEIKEPDRGFGCLVQEVNNEGVVGDICHSNENDLNCAGNGNGNGNGGSAEAPPGTWSDPIIVDLGEQSYRLTSVTDGVMFDVRNDGHATRTAWTRIGVDNAFLALDRNGNGRIDSGAELFGNFTPLRSGAIAGNGYEVLGELDDNHDGVVDRNDPAWTALLFWTDRNHDGMSTADELRHVSDSGITALETDRTLVGRKDQWGNEFRYMSHLRLQHGRHSYYDVFLPGAP